MALSLSKTLDSDVSVSYWIISRVVADLESDSLSIVLSAYVDQSAFNAGKDEVTSISIRIESGAASLLASNNALSALYSNALNDPQMSGATIV